MIFVKSLVAFYHLLFASVLYMLMEGFKYFCYSANSSSIYEMLDDLVLIMTDGCDDIDILAFK